MNDLDKFLAEAQARADAATPGPWEVRCHTDEEGCENWHIYPIDEESAYDRTYHDDTPEIRFIAAARTDLPRALALIRVLRDGLQGIYDNAPGKYIDAMRQVVDTLRRADALARGEEGSHGQ